MNRTLAIVATAAALVALSLLARPSRNGGTATPTPTTVTATEPTQPPPPAAPPVRVTATDGVLQTEARLASRYVANGGAANYLTVEVTAPEQAQPLAQRQPVNLVALIDRSGSMAGEKLARAKEAARHLVSRLGPSDRLAIVHYGTDVRSFASELATPVAKARMLEVIDEIDDDGATNIHGALMAGQSALMPYLAQFRGSRILLLSDGQPTAGDVTREGLTGAVRQIREKGITVTALGVGVDFDELLMRALAESGGGFYGYLDDPSRLPQVFARELDQAAQLLAREVTVCFDLPDGVRVDEVLGKQLFMVDGKPTVRLHDFSGGLSARLVARLSVSLPVSATDLELGKVVVRYSDLKADRGVSSSLPLQAPIITDAKVVLSHADPEVLKHAANAEAAKQLQLAAVAYRAGRAEEGKRILDFGGDNIRNLFGMSADALAGEDLSGMDGNRAAKSLESKALKNFGENNAY